MGFLLRSEILYQPHCFMPLEKRCRICKKKKMAGDGDQGHTTIQRLLHDCLFKSNKTSFSFLCAPLSDLVLHGVNDSCVGECLLMSEKWTLEKKRPLRRPKLPSLKRCKYIFFFILFSILQRGVWKVLFERATFHPFNRKCRRQARVLQRITLRSLIQRKTSLQNI